MTTTRLETLDSLRGLAALAVLVSHCLHLFPEFVARGSAPTTWLGVALKNTPLWMLVDGHGAVLVFFVLSGFVLSLPFLANTAPAWPVFAARRVVRLYPPYAAALILAAILQASFGAILPRDVTTWIANANWTDPLDAWTAADYAFMIGDRISLNNPVWSLAYEMRISLILPLLLLPTRRLGPRLGPLGSLATGLALLATYLILRGRGSHEATGALGLTALYASMFLLGALMAGQRDRLRAVRAEALPVILVLLAAVIFWRTWQDEFTTAAAAALIAAVLIPGPVARFCALGVVRFLGRISYSLYLIHMPILLTMLALLHGIVSLPVLAALIPPVAILVACLFHAAIEAPSQRLSRRIGRRTAAPVSAPV